MHGAPGSDACEEAGGGSGFTAAKAEGCPDEKGKREILERIVPHDRMKTVAENEPSGKEKSEYKNDKLDDLLARPLHPGIFNP